MDIKNIQRDRKRTPKLKKISFWITKEASEFMSKHNISPTKFFDTAIKELIGKTKK